MRQTDVARFIDQLSEGDTGPEELRRAPVHDVHPADIARALANLDEDMQSLLLSLLGDAQAAEVLSEADEPTCERILARMPVTRTAAMLDHLDPDDAADLVDLAPEERRQDLVSALEEEQRESVRELVEYPQESAGGIMTTEVVSVGANETVRSALLKVRTADQPEAVSAVYVVDPAGELVGVVQLVELLTRDDLSTAVGEIMRTDVMSVPIEADQEEVARLVEHYRLATVPVVDAANRLRGVITMDDILDVFDEEVTEDMLRLAGTNVTHPTTESLRARLVGRSPWLVITLLGSFGAGLLIQAIEHAWFGAPAGVPTTGFKSLLFFIPLIGSMSGNVGTQSCTIMIRGFATGEVDPRRPMRVLPKEMTLALVIGVLSGVLIGAMIAWMSPWGPQLGMIVGVSLPCAVLAGAATGTLIPFLCHRIHVDPAYAGGPFLSTMNDVSGYVVYFLVAFLFLDARWFG